MTLAVVVKKMACFRVSLLPHSWIVLGYKSCPETLFVRHLLHSLPSCFLCDSLLYSNPAPKKIIKRKVTKGS